MADRPKRSVEYSLEQLELVRATCLYVATKIGDLLSDVVVVGGLVPSLIIDQTALPEGTEPHPGTLDLDLGLALALLDAERYQALSERLREAGFSADVNAQGNLTRQRWRVQLGDRKVTVDFLIPPSRSSDKGGTLRDLEADFAAFIIPGLRLAFRDRQTITLRGRTILNETAERQVPVCGPGAFVVLKALAFNARGYNKDAYDLYYVVRNYGHGLEDVAERLRPLLREPEAKGAMKILRRDFLDAGGPGPTRVAQFLRGMPDDAIQADVAGFMNRLIELCRGRSRRPRSNQEPKLRTVTRKRR
jgi:hypothetical protein